jgi:hypothetical protein
MGMRQPGPMLPRTARTPLIRRLPFYRFRSGERHPMMLNYPI